MVTGQQEVGNSALGLTTPHVNCHTSAKTPPLQIPVQHMGTSLQVQRKPGGPRKQRVRDKLAADRATQQTKQSRVGTDILLYGPAQTRQGASRELTLQGARVTKHLSPR